MRRRIGTCLLAFLMLAALMVSAMAAGTPTGEKSGIYDVQTLVSGCTVTPLTAGKDGTPITADANGLYVDAAQLKVTVTGVSGKYYLALALNDTSSTPTKENIAYIDQKGEATFNVYPNELKADKEYHIWLSTDNQKLTEVASFKYYEGKAAAGKLGDVDGSGDVDFEDAILILQYDAGYDVPELEGSGFVIGDVDGSGDVDFEDAILILQYDAGYDVPELA